MGIGNGLRPWIGFSPFPFFKKKSLPRGSGCGIISFYHESVRSKMKQFPELAEIKVGKIFTQTNKETGDQYKYILAQVAKYQFCLISLDDGNRWNDPVFVDGFKMFDPIQFEEDTIKKIFGFCCPSEKYWTVD